jgi:hypothetical protein
VKAFIFCGPTLTSGEGAAELDAVFLPPAAQGDVYRATLERPWGIGIVDGYFERLPAIWHKEILWALSRGVHVFGSASMGALRAAELAAFGMEGVGAVFEAFRDGELEDDDEVAVLHGPAESDYRGVTDAMVDIRATLAAARDVGVIREPTRARLETLAKGLFYARRTYSRLVDRAVEEGLPGAELAALGSWLPENRVRRKRDDALTMLRVMRRRMAEDPGPFEAEFTFQHTEVWEELRRQARRRPLGPGGGVETYRTESALDELRLDPDAYLLERASAVSRALALELADAGQASLGPEARRGALESFWRKRRLEEPERREAWLAERGLSERKLGRLLSDEARIRPVLRLAEAQVARSIEDRLLLADRFAALEGRALAKHRALAARGLSNPGLAEAGLDEAELWRWWFGERLGRPVPEDLEAYARSLDLPDGAALRRLVLRELLYGRLAPPPSAATKKSGKSGVPGETA